MTQKMKEHIERMVGKNQKLPDVPKVSHVLLQSYDRLEAFEATYPNLIKKWCSRNETQYVNLDDESIWVAIVPTRFNTHGCRFYKVIIDSTIDDDVLYHEVLYPCLCCCQEVEFF